MFQLVLLLILSTTVLFGQVCSPGIPTLNSVEHVPIITIEHEFMSFENSNDISHLKSRVFAENIEVNYNPNNCGLWLTKNSGERVWVVGFYCSNTSSIGVIFKNFYLNKGAKIFVYNKTKSIIIGALTELNNKKYKILPVQPIVGKYIFIEMQVDPDLVDFGHLEIGTISVENENNYYDLFLKSTNTETCEADINCYNNSLLDSIKSGICKVLINGHKKCTGFLINNTKNNAEPYVITANHCISNNIEGASSIFYFNYESKGCACKLSTLPNTISGAEILATAKELDFTLLKLSVQIDSTFAPRFLGWNVLDSNLSNVLSIHHPDGEIKKLAFDFDQITRTTFSDAVDYFVVDGHWKINEWDIGTTNLGSSGAPLFDKDGYIIGILSGGEADCYLPINDYFAAINLAWDYFEDSTKQLKYWLDPSNQSITKLRAYQPFKINAQSQSDCDIETSRWSLEHIDQLKIYPNPARDILNIEIESIDNYKELGIFTMSGLLIKSIPLYENIPFCELDISDLHPGIYIIRFLDESAIYKFIKY